MVNKSKVTDEEIEQFVTELKVYCAKEKKISLGDVANIYRTFAKIVDPPRITGSEVFCGDHPCSQCPASLPTPPQPGNSCVAKLLHNYCSEQPLIKEVTGGNEVEFEIPERKVSVYAIKHNGSRTLIVKDVPESEAEEYANNFINPKIHSGFEVE